MAHHRDDKDITRPFIVNHNCICQKKRCLIKIFYCKSRLVLERCTPTAELFPLSGMTKHPARPSGFTTACYCFSWFCALARLGPTVFARGLREGPFHVSWNRVVREPDCWTRKVLPSRRRGRLRPGRPAGAAGRDCAVSGRPGLLTGRGRAERALRTSERFENETEEAAGHRVTDRALRSQEVVSVTFCW